eukprot:6213816-Pleurochrysis_carterae.AAC.2
MELRERNRKTNDQMKMCGNRAKHAFVKDRSKTVWVRMSTFRCTLDVTMTIRRIHDRLHDSKSVDMCAEHAPGHVRPKLDVFRPFRNARAPLFKLWTVYQESATTLYVNDIPKTASIYRNGQKEGAAKAASTCDRNARSTPLQCNRSFAERMRRITRSSSDAFHPHGKESSLGAQFIGVTTLPTNHWCSLAWRPAKPVRGHA